jgi:hypothetical protein
MTKKMLFTITTFIILSLLLTACQIPKFNVTRGSGNVVKESRNVSDFNEVILNGAGKLIITQSANETLEIEAEENIIDELISEVQGKTLTIGYTNRFWRRSILPNQTIIYRLNVNDIDEITLNGANQLEIDSFETNSLEIVLNGAGQIDIDALLGESLDVHVAGTGTVTIAGQVESQRINIDGAGNYQAGNLQTNTTEIEIDGLGNGTVWATNNLDITINGGGSINYYGTPSVTQDINGLGDISSKGDK